jgi:replicative DNA helicase
MDISAVVLHKLLTEQNLDLWAKLKLGFLDPAYSSVYSAISRHYNKYSNIPTFDDLEVSLREGATSKSVAALRLVDAEDIDAEVALDALIDQFTQNETIKLLDRFVDKLPIYDTVEIKDNLANIVLTLDEKTLTTEGVYSMSDIMLFQQDVERARNRVFLGINNTFDAVLNGVARQELILIGGKRGSGKSITVNNLMVNQYELGNSCVYFSIEMTGYETLERTMSILANVNQQNLKQNKCTDEEVLRLVKARAGMFTEADDLVNEFLKNKDRYKFEERLVREKQLKVDNQMIIIDDRALSLTSIDLHVGKLKAKFGDKLGVVVVDYLNQIVVEGGYSQFDWQPQVIVSKKLKEIARKYDVVMISPYQIDATGEARFAKGILDAADIALTMEAHDKDTGALTFDTSKIRGGREMKFTSPIDWDTLKISPHSIDTPIKKEAVKKAGKGSHKVDDSGADIPWNKD